MVSPNGKPHPEYSEAGGEETEGDGVPEERISSSNGGEQRKVAMAAFAMLTFNKVRQV